MYIKMSAFIWDHLLMICVTRSNIGVQVPYGADSAPSWLLDWPKNTAQLGLKPTDLWIYFIPYFTNYSALSEIVEKYYKTEHSGMGMVMTLEFSNMDKIYIFGTLRALGITWHMQFFPLPSLPKSLVRVPHFTLISPISIVILCFLKKSC